MYFLLNPQNDWCWEVVLVGEEVSLPPVFPTHSTCASIHLTIIVTFPQFECLSPQFFGMPCLSWWTVPQQFISHCVGQKTVVAMKKWLSMNSVCPTPCIFLVSCRTVPWVGIILKVAFKNCSKWVVMLYMYQLPSQSLYSFIPNLLCVFEVYCQNTTLPFNFTITSSNTKFSVGWFGMECILFR